VSLPEVPHRVDECEFGFALDLILAGLKRRPIGGPCRGGQSREHSRTLGHQSVRQSEMLPQEADPANDNQCDTGKEKEREKPPASPRMALSTR